MNLKIAVLGLTLFAAMAPFAGAQAPQPGEPVEIKLGDNIELAEFVSISPLGVRVKLADGSMKILPSTHVRRPQGAAARPPPPAAAQPLDPRLRSQRKWTDSSGKFTVTATFSKLAGDQVELKRSDGKTVSLPLDKLSPADRELAISLATTVIQQTDSTDATADSGSADAIPSSGISSSAQINVDFKAAPVLSPTPPANWSFKTDAVIPAKEIPNRPYSVAAARRDPSHDSYFNQQLHYVEWAHQFWTVVRNKTKGNLLPSRIERTDIRTGNLMRSLRLQTVVDVIEIHPDGKFLVGLNDADNTNRNQRIDLYQVDKAGITLVKSFSPFVAPGAPADQSHAEVSEVRFLENNLLLTVNKSRMLVVWDMNSMRPLYRIEQAASTSFRPTVSPSRRQILMGNGSTVQVLEAQTGAVLGQFEPHSTPAHLGGSLYWRPDNKEVALNCDGVLTRWDLRTGELLASHVSFPKLHWHLVWLSDDMIYQSGAGIYALEHDLPFCAIFAQPQDPVVGGKLYSLARTDNGIVEGFNIQATSLVTPELMGRYRQIRPEDYLAIQPGERIRLELDLPFEPTEIQRIRDEITQKLKANGWDVGDDAEVVCSAKVKPGITKEVIFRMINPSESRYMSVTQQIGTITLKRGEVTYWSTQMSWGPVNVNWVNVRNGETFEQAAEVKPPPSFFTSTNIPRRLMKSPGDGFMLKATPTPQGLKIR